MNNKKRILITGFEPFGGESLNPSQILLEKFQQDSVFSEQVDFMLLPVVFERAQIQLGNVLNDQHYDWVFHLGQAGGRETVSVEQVALNWMGALQDESGYVPDEAAIESSKPAAYISPLPLRKLVVELKAKGLPVSLSQSAGVFLCNFVYFQSCQILEAQGRGAHAVFIHVPYVPEQVVNKPGKPALGFEAIEQSVSEIIHSLLKS